MVTTRQFSVCLALASSLGVWLSPVAAGPVAITNTFSNGTVADADQVNQNFSDVKSAVDDNDARIAINETSIAGKQDKLSGSVCPAGQVVQSIATDGTTTCVVDAGGGSADGHSLDAVDGNPVDAVFVDAIGNVGIGTTTPASPLTVTGPLPLFESDSSTVGARWRFGTDFAGDFIINKTSGTTFSPVTVSETGQVFVTRDSGGVIPDPPCTTLTINNNLPGLFGCIEGIMIGDPLGGAIWMGHDVNANQSVILAWIGVANRARLQSVGGPLIMQETSGQNVGIGTTTPATTLDVNGTVTATAFVQTSDRRQKRDIRGIEAALEKVSGLRGVSFRWNEQTTRGARGDPGEHFGLIAQEVAAVVPEAASHGNDGDWAVNYGAIVPILVEAIKEQQRMIADLQQQVAAVRQGNLRSGSLSVSTAEADPDAGR